MGGYTPTPTEVLDNIAAGRDPNQPATVKPASVSEDTLESQHAKIKELVKGGHMSQADYTMWKKLKGIKD